jgi:hypothetical protein
VEQAIGVHGSRRGEKWLQGGVGGLPCSSRPQPPSAISIDVECLDDHPSDKIGTILGGVWAGAGKVSRHGLAHGRGEHAAGGETASLLASPRYSKALTVHSHGFIRRGRSARAPRPRGPRPPILSPMPPTRATTAAPSSRSTRRRPSWSTSSCVPTPTVSPPGQDGHANRRVRAS